jgi:murein DD-endopeptidase MepM/ murein hydrolase activator NlpD
MRITLNKILMVGGAFLLLGGAGLFLHTGEDRKEPVTAGASAEPTAEDPEQLPEREPDEPVRFHKEVGQDETAGGILQEWLSMAEIQELSDVCQGVFALNRLRAGQPYVVTFTPEEFISFEYEVDSEQKLLVLKEGRSFSARLEAIPYERQLARVNGKISSHLFQAVADAGETPALATALAEIFAWEINFLRDLRPGDSFTVMVEKRLRNGEFSSYGRILAATFTNRETTYEAFLFKDSRGVPQYFTAKGESVKRAFLKAPLEFTRISSTFSNRRLHPVLQVWRAHPGIDYAAPTGTPVQAVGGGMVAFAGWGAGAGNYVALRHSNGFETLYLHLSKFARSAKKGNRVRQGEIIGYVGSTGVSTGPHLDFRMKKNGSYVNPLKILSPRSDPVAPAAMPAYLAHAALWRGCLEGKNDGPDCVKPAGQAD